MFSTGSKFFSQKIEKKKKATKIIHTSSHRNSTFLWEENVVYRQKDQNIPIATNCQCRLPPSNCRPPPLQSRALLKIYTIFSRILVSTKHKNCKITKNLIAFQIQLNVITKKAILENNILSNKNLFYLPNTLLNIFCSKNKYGNK